MSDLRKNIDSLKHDYSSLKYPGDLASDVPLESDRPMLIRFAPVLALAAAVAVAATVWVMTRAVEPKVENNLATHDPPAKVDANDDRIASSFTDVPEESFLPAMPERESHVISAPSWSGISSGGFSASMVSMPAQSMSIPTVTEIDDALATSSTNSDI